MHALCGVFSFGQNPFVNIATYVKLIELDTSLQYLWLNKWELPTIQTSWHYWTGLDKAM